MTTAVSNLMEKEEIDVMNVQEVARAIEWVRAMGLSDADACNLLTYIATGVGLPVNKKTSDV